MSSTRPIWKERQRRSSLQPRVAPQALPWVSRPEFCNPERVEPLSLTALMQPLQGCFSVRRHPQGRRSCLAPTLGCMMERRWRSCRVNSPEFRNWNGSARFPASQHSLKSSRPARNRGTGKQPPRHEERRGLPAFVLCALRASAVGLSSGFGCDSAALSYIAGFQTRERWKSSNRSESPMPCRLGSRRYSRFGDLRYAQRSSHFEIRDSAKAGAVHRADQADAEEFQLHTISWQKY